MKFLELKKLEKSIWYNASSSREGDMTPKQREMLISFERDGEATDICDFYNAGTLFWRNRERVIEALHRKGYLNADGITEVGRNALRPADGAMSP
jgi:hypothetical protein